MASSASRLTRVAAAWVVTLAVGAALSGCTGTTTPTAVVSGTPVPAPSGGNVSETVASATVPSAVETDLTATAEVAAGLKVRVAKVEAIEAKAQGAGEVSGPALAITVEVENIGTEPFDSSLMSVNLEDSKGLPGPGMSGPPAAWLSGVVPAGGKASGVYVFTVAKANRKPIHVSVSANPGLSTAVFSGNP